MVYNQTIQDRELAEVEMENRHISLETEFDYFFVLWMVRVVTFK